MTHYEELVRYLPLAAGIELASLVRRSAHARSSTSWLDWPRPPGSRVTSRRIRSATDWRLSLSVDEYVNQRCRRSLDMLRPQQRESTFISRRSKSPTSIRTPSGPIDRRAIPPRIRRAARWQLDDPRALRDSRRLHRQGRPEMPRGMRLGTRGSRTNSRRNKRRAPWNAISRRREPRRRRNRQCRHWVR